MLDRGKFVTAATDLRMTQADNKVNLRVDF